MVEVGPRLRWPCAMDESASLEVLAVCGVASKKGNAEIEGVSEGSRRFGGLDTRTLQVELAAARGHIANVTMQIMSPSGSSSTALALR